VCEERLNHEHPFIKILHPKDEPKVILTGVEDEKSTEEVNWNRRGECFKKFAKMFCKDGEMPANLCGKDGIIGNIMKMAK
jgi:hypothetical protein